MSEWTGGEERGESGINIYVQEEKGKMKKKGELENALRSCIAITAATTSSSSVIP